MQKEKLALNYALMIEMVRSAGVREEAFLHMLEEGSAGDFDTFGEGIPDWQTFLDFYHANPDKIRNALQSGYRITFLTKGALKSLLGIKFGLERDVDFRDNGFYLDQVNLTGEQLQELNAIIADNWIVTEEAHNGNMYELKIALRNPPAE